MSIPRVLEKPKLRLLDQVFFSWAFGERFDRDFGELSRTARLSLRRAVFKSCLLRLRRSFACYTARQPFPFLLLE